MYDSGQGQFQIKMVEMTAQVVWIWKKSVYIDLTKVAAVKRDNVIK